MLKQFLRNIVLGEKASSERYVSYLRKQGVSVGEHVRFYSPMHTVVDLTCPCLLSIGNNVSITQGVIILTHDYSWSVRKQLPDSDGEILGGPESGQNRQQCFYWYECHHSVYDGYEAFFECLRWKVMCVKC